MTLVPHTAHAVDSDRLHDNEKKQTVRVVCNPSSYWGLQTADPASVRLHVNVRLEGHGANEA